MQMLEIETKLMTSEKNLAEFLLSMDWMESVQHIIRKNKNQFEPIASTERNKSIAHATTSIINMDDGSRKQAKTR